jgi:hypothetical protein
MPVGYPKEAMHLPLDGRQDSPVPNAMHFKAELTAIKTSSQTKHIEYAEEMVAEIEAKKAELHDYIPVMPNKKQKLVSWYKHLPLMNRLFAESSEFSQATILGEGVGKLFHAHSEAPTVSEAPPTPEASVTSEAPAAGEAHLPHEVTALGEGLSYVGVAVHSMNILRNAFIWYENRQRRNIVCELVQVSDSELVKNARTSEREGKDLYIKKGDELWFWGYFDDQPTKLAFKEDKLEEFNNRINFKQPEATAEDLKLIKECTGHSREIPFNKTKGLKTASSMVALGLSIAILVLIGSNPIGLAVEIAVLGTIAAGVAFTVAAATLSKSWVHRRQEKKEIQQLTSELKKHDERLDWVENQIKSYCDKLKKANPATDGQQMIKTQGKIQKLKMQYDNLSESKKDLKNKIHALEVKPTLKSGRLRDKIVAIPLAILGVVGAAVAISNPVGAIIAGSAVMAGVAYGLGFHVLLPAYKFLKHKMANNKGVENNQPDASETRQAANNVLNNERTQTIEVEVAAQNASTATNDTHVTDITDVTGATNVDTTIKETCGNNETPVVDPKEVTDLGNLSFKEVQALLSTPKHGPESPEIINGSALTKASATDSSPTAPTETTPAPTTNEKPVEPMTQSKEVKEVKEVEGDGCGTPSM